MWEIEHLLLDVALLVFARVRRIVDRLAEVDSVSRDLRLVIGCCSGVSPRESCLLRPCVDVLDFLEEFILFVLSRLHGLLVVHV